MALRHERPNVAPTCPWRRGACYRSTGSRLRRETCAGGARGFPGTAGGSTGGPERALAAGSGERSVTFDNLITALRGGGRASGACPVACARELERSDYGGFARFRRQGAHCGTGQAAASQIPKFPAKSRKGFAPTSASSPVLLRNHQMNIKDGLSYSRDDSDPVRDCRGTD